MCIRDRASGDLAPLAHLALVVVGEGEARVGGQLMDGGAAPVSYTHLRAHETVLDIVCRLLLEKKKNHIPETQC